MITIEQLKAARALLGWTQRQLAEASGLSLATLANVEQGKGKSHGKTMTAISHALMNAGIEFTPEPGVRLMREKFSFRVFEGENAVAELWDDIIVALGATGGEVLMSGISERYWLEHYKEALIDNILRQRKLDISTRLLIEEGDNLVLIGQASYRAIPPYLFNQMPSYIYADRYATIMWGPPLRILVIQNTLLVQNFRKQFEYNYSIGKRISDDQVIIPRLEGLPYLPGN